MKLLRFDREIGRQISQFESRASIVPIIRSTEGVQVGCMYLEPDGLVGYHQAIVPQLFLVVSGSGWVTGANRARVPIEAGRAALWQASEWHESGSDVGMVAIVIEGEGFDAIKFLREVE